MRKNLGFLCLLALGGLAVYAADFWKDKAYTQWSDDEVNKMLSDSPWAQNTKTTMEGQQPMGQRGMGRRGGMGGGGWGGMGGGGMGGPRRGGPMGGSTMPAITVTVRWQSALPEREALLRQAGVTKTDDSAAAAKLTAPAPGYVIAIVGLPLTPPSRDSGVYQRGGDSDSDSSSNRDPDLDRMKSATYLNRKDRPSLFPDKIERDKDGATILVTFPKTTPISLDDKEVEFVSRYGAMQIKRKFKLKDMRYQGKLEL